MSHPFPLAADALGAPGAPAVLLLHGGGQTRHSWGDTLPVLAAAGLRAIALDLRGHGESAWTGAYELDAFADDVEAAIADVGAPVAIVGASLGGLIGLILAGERHVPCWALVLVDVAPRIEVAGRERVMAFMRARPDGFASLEEAAAEVEAYTGRPRPDDLGGLHRNLRRGEDGRWRWHWDPEMLDGPRALDPTDQPRFEAAARGVDVPTLLVRGGRSDVLGDAGREQFLALVPGARAVEVPDAGHMVAGDDNLRFAAAVRDFLIEVRDA